MELLQGDAFDGLFGAFEHTAFHLEVNDAYHTPDEAGPFGLFLAGEPDDFAWHEPWLALVRTATGEGRHISRVRVVTEPHVDYTRWGLAVAPLNIAAGEEIRWLPRHRTTPDSLTADDFWLFDDNRVVFTIFEPDGRFAGGAQTVDPVIVDRCRQVHETVWKLAVPHDVYLNG
jgi:hypothetical protein